MIAALFVQRFGTYWGQTGIDAWDEKRDARKYDGPWPIVAHPPCQKWSLLANVNKHRYGGTIGNDKGCFLSALTSLRKWGGVLEHPRGSYAFSRFGIIRPIVGKWERLISDIWITEVNQSAYGHMCQKPTWLIYSGANAPFELNWSKGTWTHQVGGTGRTLPQLKKSMRSLTPIRFKNLLISLTEHSRPTPSKTF